MVDLTYIVAGTSIATALILIGCAIYASCRTAVSGTIVDKLYIEPCEYQSFIIIDGLPIPQMIQEKAHWVLVVEDNGVQKQVTVKKAVWDKMQLGQYWH